LPFFKFDNFFLIKAETWTDLSRQPFCARKSENEFLFA